jgi:hypothetical protein
MGIVFVIVEFLGAVSILYIGHFEKQFKNQINKLTTD